MRGWRAVPSQGSQGGLPASRSCERPPSPKSRLMAPHSKASPPASLAHVKSLCHRPRPTQGAQGPLVGRSDGSAISTPPATSTPLASSLPRARVPGGGCGLCGSLGSAHRGLDPPCPGTPRPPLEDGSAALQPLPTPRTLSAPGAVQTRGARVGRPPLSRYSAGTWPDWMVHRSLCTFVELACLMLLMLFLIYCFCKCILGTRSGSTP